MPSLFMLLTLTTTATALAAQAPLLTVINELLFCHDGRVGIVAALLRHIALVIGHAHHQMRGFYPQTPQVFNAI